MSLFSELVQDKPSVMVRDDKSRYWQEKMQTMHNNVPGLMELLFEQLLGHNDIPDEEPLDVEKALDLLTRDSSGKVALLPAVIHLQQDRMQLLESLGALCLRHVRGLGEAPKQSPEAERLGRAWKWLRNQCFPLGCQRIRWDRPLVETNGQTPLQEARSLLREIDQLTGRETRVCFPTIGATIGDVQVMVLRLTALKPSGQDGMPLPAVQVAPWSIYGIDAGTHYTLDGLAKELPHLQVEGRRASVPVLLELYPAGEDYKRRDEPLLRPPATLDLNGDSLSLAFCLAAWALNHDKYLRRICATGIVLKTGKIARIGMGLPGEDKLKPVVDLFFRVNRHVIFFIPKGNEPDRYVSLKLLPNVVINGRREHREVTSLEHLDNLCSRERQSILTDCFDEYRLQVREWELKDRQAYDMARTHFDTSDQTRVVVLREFGDDPIPAAATVARALIDRIEDEDVRTPAYASECPIPLLLPLEECKEEGDASAPEVASVLEVGIAHWKKHSLHFEVDPYFQDLLEQVARREPGKLWLIVYCGKSLTMKPYEDLRKRIDRLQAYLKGRTNHLVFIASDYHHYLMLSKHLKLGTHGERL